MRSLFDTSVLVAGMVEDHPHYEPAQEALRNHISGNNELHICQHSLAECFAVLTTLPVQPKISPDTANRMITNNVIDPGTIIELDGEDYTEIIDRQALKGNNGGSVYDALIAKSASKVNADQLLTFNLDDFKQVWPEGESIIKRP